MKTFKSNYLELLFSNTIGYKRIVEKYILDIWAMGDNNIMIVFCKYGTVHTERWISKKLYWEQRNMRGTMEKRQYFLDKKHFSI